MAALLTNHAPIRVYQTRTNTTEQTQSYPEAAGQTFLFGTPVTQDASGNIIPCTTPTSGAPRTILGISESNAFNLPTAGAGSPPLFGSVGFPGAAPTYGTVPNQPPAVNIVAGSTFVDGRTMVAQAVDTTIFIGQTDAATGAVYAPTNAMVGHQFNLVLDPSGHWYVDLGSIDAGAGTSLTMLGIYPNDYAPGSITSGVNNALIFFTFNIAVTRVQQ